MDKLLVSTMILILVSCSTSSSINQKIISEDIQNFWTAYDKIQTTNDSLQQLEYMKEFFIDPSTIGQKKMIEVRNYTPEEYLQSILNYPKFWNSLRSNTKNLTQYNKTLKEGVEKLKLIYPDYTPATIYYTVGVHRSPGTGIENMVLIGTEYALGDTQTITTELNPHIQNYYKINPIEHLQFLIVHEYVHTQQKGMVHNLLSLSLYEGIADFVAYIATHKSSPFKAFKYGPKHDEKIRNYFQQDIFNPNVIYDWLWNSPNNEFQTSDLGYYVGYKIASLYYINQTNKKKAIKELIELDYTDKESVEKLVDGTHYFTQPLKVLSNKFEQTRPRVTKIKQFSNNSKDIDISTTQITLVFSEPMNTERMGFDYGPLGEENVLRVQNVIGFSEDDKEFTFSVRLEPNKQYQSMVSSRFQSKKGKPLQPFLINFHTSE